MVEFKMVEFKQIQPFYNLPNSTIFGILWKKKIEIACCSGGVFLGKIINKYFIYDDGNCFPWLKLPL